MPAQWPYSWADLLATKAATNHTLEFRVLNRAGAAFLILPKDNAAASRALTLYAAQTNFAKTAKRTLDMALRVGLPAGLSRTRVNFSPSDAFPSFLRKVAKTETFPTIAILAGNPGAEGRRFIILVFDEKAQPACVVKAGIGDVARKLIRHESNFLSGKTGGISGAPKFCAAFDSEEIEAVAMEFVEGESPRAEDWRGLGRMLGEWVNHDKEICVADAPVWEMFDPACCDEEMFQRVAEELSERVTHPAIWHGDFAPWNIKVSAKDGAWRVLDWERGETIGLPGWDWFHYVTQTAILVEKLEAEDVFRRVEELLKDETFKDYAAKAKIAGSERALFAAYLLYCVNVVRPGEGIETDRELLRMCFERWWGTGIKK